MGMLGSGGAVWPNPPQALALGMLGKRAPHCNEMPKFSEMPPIGGFRFHIPFFAYELFWFSNTCSPDSQGFLDTYFLLNPFLHFRAPRIHLWHSQPVHLITAFPCLLSPPYFTPQNLSILYLTLKTKQKTYITQADLQITFPSFKITVIGFLLTLNPARSDHSG